MSVEDFKFDFTLEQVEDMLKGNSEAEEWYVAMCHVLPQYGITTEARVAAFIAQCGHESNNFKVLSENILLLVIHMIYQLKKQQNMFVKRMVRWLVLVGIGKLIN